MATTPTSPEVPKRLSAPVAAPEAVVRIPLELPDENPYQRRRDMDPSKLKELTASVLQDGLLQPVIVRKVGERYQLIAGHRRTTVYRRLSQEHADKPQFSAIEARVRSGVSNFDMALLVLIENAQREDPSPLDDAEGLVQLMQLRADLKTPKDISAVTGWQVDRVRRLLALANVAPVIKEGLRTGFVVPATSSDAKGEVSDSAKERSERRSLDMLMAVELGRLHEHIATSETDTKYDMKKVADEKIGKLIHRALRDNWGLRRVSTYVREALAGGEEPNEAEAPPKPQSPFRDDSRQLVIHRARLAGMSPEQRKALRSALEPVWTLVASA
jgi:ParB/RepB/Spo0J family partition protein